MPKIIKIGEHIQSVKKAARFLLDATKCNNFEHFSVSRGSAATYFRCGG